MILGFAFEEVGFLDSAKESYEYLLNNCKNYDKDTLNFGTRLTYATLLTIVEGKAVGYSEIQNLFSNLRTK